MTKNKIRLVKEGEMEPTKYQAPGKVEVDKIHLVKEREMKYSKKTPTKNTGLVYDIKTSQLRTVFPNEVTPYDIPIYTNLLKNPTIRDNLIIDIRKMMKKVKKRPCEINTLDKICEINNLVTIHHSRLQEDRSFNLLLEDIDKMKKDFIDNCKMR